MRRVLFCTWLLGDSYPGTQRLLLRYARTVQWHPLVKLSTSAARAAMVPNACGLLRYLADHARPRGGASLAELAGVLQQPAPLPQPPQPPPPPFAPHRGARSRLLRASTAFSIVQRAAQVAHQRKDIATVATRRALRASHLSSSGGAVMRASLSGAMDSGRRSGSRPEPGASISRTASVLTPRSQVSLAPRRRVMQRREQSLVAPLPSLSHTHALVQNEKAIRGRSSSCPSHKAPLSQCADGSRADQHRAGGQHKPGRWSVRPRGKACA